MLLSVLLLARLRSIPGADVGLSGDNAVKCHLLLVATPAWSYFLYHNPVAPANAGRSQNTNIFRTIQAKTWTLFKAYFAFHWNENTISQLPQIVEGNWKGAFGKWLLSFPLFYAFYKIQFCHYCLESLDRNMSPVTWDFISFCSTSDIICGYSSSGFLMFAVWRWHCTAGHNQKQWKCCLS